MACGGPIGAWWIGLAANSDYILYLLMFSVGISVGMHHGLWNKLKQYHIKILVVPAGIVVGSMLGGILCGLLTGHPLNRERSRSLRARWYSLAGATLGKLAGAQMGSITFLSNLMREIFSFFSIAWLSKHLNAYSCIAAAGATSEDTTLPMMIRYTNDEAVVFSVMNGVICSALVPVLIRLLLPGLVIEIHRLLCCCIRKPPPDCGGFAVPGCRHDGAPPALYIGQGE